MAKKEFLISNKELTDRINWTFEQKVFHAIDTSSSFLYHNPCAECEFSGGLDSTALLHICRRLNKDLKANFKNTTNEFSSIIHHVKNTENVQIHQPKMTFIQCIERFGFPLISKKNARMISDCRHPTGKNNASINLYLTGYKQDGQKGKFIIPKSLRYLLDVPFDISHKCCSILKHGGSSHSVGLFIGTMATDSDTRKNGYLQNGCINYNDNTCRPLSVWTKADVWNYIRKYNVPYADIYDKGETHTGCAYCGMGILFDRTRYDRLKALEPKRFEQMMEVKNNGVRFIDAIQMVLQKPKRVGKN